MRFSEMALNKIRSEFPAWNSGFVTPKCWLSFVKASCDPPANEFEGQVLVTVSVSSAHADISLAGQESYFASTMHSRLSIHGDVRTVSCMLATVTTVALKVEFYSLAATSSPELENQSSPFPVSPLRISKSTDVSFFFQGLRLSVSRYGVKTTLSRSSFQGSSSRLYGSPRGAQNFQLIAPSGDSRVYNIGHDRLIMDNSTRHPRKWTSSLTRALESPSANHNVVDVERIRRGQDVRTTVRMLVASRASSAHFY